MFEEELEPVKVIEKPVDMEPMSIEALESYIAGLEAEIARARDAIAAKQGQRSEADRLFKG